MDVLAEIMSLLHTKGHLYGRIELGAPFGLEFPGGKGICIIVTRGACHLGVDGHPLVALTGGDFAFLPTPQTYSFRSSPNARLRSVLKLITPDQFHKSRVVEYHGGGAPTSIIAGCFTFASPESDLLVRHLPPIIHLPADGTHATPWFQSTLQLIAAESAADRPGSSAIVDRLAEVLFVHAMRSRIQSLAGMRPSWLRALADPQVSEALRLMHAEPGRAWTVSLLARKVSMSRSAFAERFRALAGETPLEHLTQWRMVRAAAILRQTRPPKMAAIAAAVGYQAESSFGKVFRRVMGSSPGTYHKMYSNGATNNELMSERLLV